MQGVRAGKDAFLLQRIRLPVDAVHIADAFHKGAHFVCFFVPFDELFHHGMLGGKGHEGNAKERVGARGEHVDALDAFGQQGGIFNAKGNGSTRGFANPVALHGDNAVGPATLEGLQVLQQLVAVGRDLEKPLGQILLHHAAVAAPAQAVNDLFVGEHRMA